MISCVSLGAGRGGRLLLPRPWGTFGAGEVAPFSLALGAPLGLGLGEPLGLGQGWKRGDTDDFGTDLRVIPRGRGWILHLRRKIFSFVVSVLFRGKCVQLWSMFSEVFLVRIWLVLGI